MAGFLGDSATMVVHDLEHEQPACGIADIAPENRVEFPVVAAAHLKGYENCQHCPAWKR